MQSNAKSDGKLFLILFSTLVIIFMARPEASFSNTQVEHKDIPYTVAIIGAPDEEIEELLKQASGTIQSLSRPVRSLMILKQ